MKHPPDNITKWISGIWRLTLLKPIPAPAFVEQLNNIASIHYPSAIPHIAALIFAVQDDRLQAAISATVDTAIARCSVRELVVLDRTGRQYSGWMCNDFGPQSRLPLDAPGSGLLGILSFNANGFIRESAVRQLARRFDGNELPFLLLRLRDWVPQVRLAALAAVSERMSPAHANHFLRCLPIINILSQMSDPPVAETISLIYGLLAGPEWLNALYHAAMVEPAEASFTATSILLHANPIEVQELLLGMVRCGPWTGQRRCFDALCHRLSGEQLLELLAACCRKRPRPIRAAAINLLALKFPESAEPHLRHALMDRSSAVRNAAAYHLRRTYGDGIGQFYRDQVQCLTDRALAWAIAGLGENGSAEDSGLIRRFVRHPMPAIRRATLVATWRLAKTEAIPLLYEALTDPSESVRNAARVIISAGRQRPDFERLSQIFFSWNGSVELRQTIRLAARLPWWDSAILLLRAVSLVPPEDRTCAIGELVRWQANSRRLQVRPQREQISAFEQALARAAAYLPEETSQDLRDLLSLARSIWCLSDSPTQSGFSVA